MANNRKENASVWSVFKDRLINYRNAVVYFVVPEKLLFMPLLNENKTMVLLNTSSQSIALYTTFILLTQAFSPVITYAAEDIVANPDPEESISQSDQTDTDSSIPLPVDSLSTDEQERLQQALLRKEQYLQVIDRHELESGSDAYSAELSQAYIDLGLTLQILNQHEEAAVAFDNALQSTRITNGLNSPFQLPILQELLESNTARSDWDGADANSHLIYYIARKNYPVGDERRLAALKQLGKWKIRAANEQLVSGSSNYASEATELYQQEIAQLETMPLDGNLLSLATLLLGEAEMKLSLAKQIFERPLTDFQTTGQKSVTTTRCFFVRLPSGGVGQMCETIEEPRLEYFTEPNERKIRAISSNLDDIRTALLDTFSVLQVETDQTEKRDTLLTEMQRITESYNAFVTDNSL